MPTNTTETVPPATGLDIVLDIKVQVTVRLGSTMMAMADVLALTPGAIVHLKERPTEPLSLYVNDKLFAYGEVVVTGDNFGIKVIELVGRPGIPA
jgi:flagellar motor switch protein FliN/FliY